MKTFEQEQIMWYAYQSIYILFNMWLHLTENPAIIFFYCQQLDQYM